MRPKRCPRPIAASSRVTRENALIGRNPGISASSSNHAFGDFKRLGRMPAGQRFPARQTAELRMMLNQEPVDRPRTPTQAIEQFRQRREGFAVFTDLPLRKTEAPLGALEAKHLMVLTFGVDRHSASADKIRKFFGAQHVSATENISNPRLPALTCCG